MPEYISQQKGETAEMPSSFFDRESKVLYTVEHDSKYLYLNLSSTDIAIQRQILRGGLTIWIDQSGRKKKYFGFRYPLLDKSVRPGNVNKGGRNAESLSPMGNEKEIAHRLFRQFEEQISYIELLGFLEEGSFERLNYRLEKGPVKVHISMNEDGKLLYNARVLLSDIFSNAESRDGVLSIGVIGNVPEGGKPDRPNSGGAAEGRGGQGGGQRGGGQGRPPGGAMDGEGNTGASSSIYFWFKVQL